MSNSSKEIKHRAKIVRITTNCVDVAVEASEACSSCHAKSICTSGSDQEKIISVFTDNAPLYQVGEDVEVAMQRTMGIKAVMWAYMFPFLLVFTLLLILLQTGCGELASGLVSLATLIIYYFALYLLRNRISKEINFKIYRINE